MIGVVAGLLIGGSALAAGVVIAVGRALVAPPRAPTCSYARTSTEIILGRTLATSVDGTFRLRHPTGSAVVGRITGDHRGRGCVGRKLISVAGDLPFSGSASFHRDVHESPSDAGLDYSDVAIPTAHGPAPAWIVPGVAQRSTKGLWVLHLHGIRTTRSVTLPSVIAASRAGATSLVVSWRNDGEGPDAHGGRSTLGATEWADVDDAVQYAVSQGASSVVLVGWSMGAVLADRVRRRSEHASLIRGLVYIAPVTSWRAALGQAVRRVHLPHVAARLVELLMRGHVGARIVGLRSPVDLAHLEIDASCSLPLLLVHNEGDPVMPASMSGSFVERYAGDAQFELFAPSGHATEWNNEPDRFENVLREWMADPRHH